VPVVRTSRGETERTGPGRTFKISVEVGDVSELGEVYSRYLESKRWDTFITVTFRKPRRDSIYNGQSVWTYLHERYPVQKAFLISEPHTTGFLHYHGLLGFYPAWNPTRHELINGLQNEEIEEGCYRVFGRTDVSAIKMLENVASYCTKYVLKAVDNPSVDYNLYGDWKS